MEAVEQFVNDWGVLLGVGGLIAFMAFIIWDLAKKSNAGKFGTFVLFAGLGVGMLGYIIKVVIQYFMESGAI